MTRTNVKDLGEFEGQPVSATTIAIRNAGDGLSNAMAVDPTVMHRHDTVYVVLECDVIDVQHPGLTPDSREVVRKHILKAGNATLINHAAVKTAIKEQADRIAAARDAETGANAIAGFTAADPLSTTPAPDRTTPAKARGATKKAGAKRARKPAKKPAKKGGHLSSVPTE